MKNICAFSLILLLLLSLNVQAQNSPYTVTDADVTVTAGVLTRYAWAGSKPGMRDAPTAITFPSMLDGQTVTSIGDFAVNLAMLTSLDLSSLTSLTSIGNYAFASSRLTSVTLPISLTSIGYNAFESNQLTSLDLSSLTSLTSIGNYAFARNQLTSLDLSSLTSTSIGASAFASNQLTSLTLPTSLTSIWSVGVFSGNKLTSLDLSSLTSLTSIGNYAFEGNKLTSLTLPTSLTSIGEYAFQDNELTSVNLSSLISLTNIGEYAFSRNKLTSLDLSSLTSLTSIGVGVFGSNRLISLILPVSLTSIGISAFQNNRYAATSLDLSSLTSLTSIGISAFRMNGLISLTLPSSITSIGAFAFQDNPQVSSLDLSSLTSLTSIGRKAFFGTQLTSLTLPPATPGYTTSWTGGHMGGTTITNLIMDYTRTATTPITYTITYELDGGTNSMDNPTSYTIESNTIPLMTPTRDGYTFGGWYSDVAFTTPVTEIVAGTTGVQTFHAKWMGTPYTITYELNGGTHHVDNPRTYTVESSIPLMPPTRGGYTFGGWYSDVAFTTPVTEIVAGTTGVQTFHAKWTATPYTITYELDGGTNSMDNPTSYTIESNTIPLMTPTREGYTFGGWYSDVAFTTPVTEIAAGTTGVQTFHAKWMGTPYTITYELNGGTHHVDNPRTYTVESSIPLMPPTRGGYTFGGWYSDVAFTTPVTEIVAGTTGVQTFHAKWTATPYTITYELDGGTNSMDNPTSYTIESNTIPLMTPTREGYTFGGWYSDVAFTTPVTEIVAGTTGVQTFHAKWMGTSYTITYELNGGTHHVDNPRTYTVESSITLISPTRDGYTFGGWYSDVAFTTPVTEIVAGTTGVQTFHAKWTATPYTITYELDGGTNSMDNPTSYTIESNTIPLMTPTRDGYTFGGWYSDVAFTTPVTEIVAGTTGVQTFHAKWMGTPYTITYELNGGTHHVDNPRTYTVESSIPLMPPTRGGYTFGGWYSDVAFTTPVTEIVAGTTGVQTFHAKWTATPYTITYELDGGTNSMDNPTSYTIESNTIPLMTPTREGYTFGGWYSDVAFTTPVTEIAAGTTGVQTFHAKWMGTPYTITYELNGGTHHVDNPRTYTVESSIPLMPPTRGGYTFGGWYSDVAFTTPVTEIVAGTTGVQTFHAKWTATPYTITYELDGGTNSMDNPTSYTIESNTIPLMTPTREGYTFGGWYSDVAFTTPVTEIVAGTTGVQTFHAKWMGTSYTITYELNGGTHHVDNPRTYTVESSITLISPTRDGYTFGGWYSDVAFTTPVTEIVAGTTGVQTFHAKWTATPYTITYELDGGTNSMDNPTSYTIESNTIPLMTPTREGYTFGDWYSDVAFTTSATEIVAGTTGDKTFYAKWETVLSLVDAYRDNTISIYPNPANDHFRLSRTSSERPQQMMLYDLSGQLVRQFSGTGDNSYKVSGLPEGVYLLNVSEKGTKTTTRLLIIR